jgi:dolichol-phosphate mannosyltransferase
MNESMKAGAEIAPQRVVTPQLSVIIPTFNERDNVVVLFQRLAAALAGVSWEAIFVDDNSPDGTSDVVHSLALQDARARCIRRIGRRGLSGACIEGILASSARCVAVIDADLQHDETRLPTMLVKPIWSLAAVTSRAAAPTVSIGSAPAPAHWPRCWRGKCCVSMSPTP